MSAVRGVVYLAGSNWESVPGTDWHLTGALAESAPVLFVDPPVPVVRYVRRRAGQQPISPAGLTHLGPNLHRLRVLGPPYLTRGPIFSSTVQVQQQAVRLAVRKLAMTVDLVVVASPWNGFPQGVPGKRMLYLTDDWERGAALLGLNAGAISRQLDRNLRSADLAAGVSDALVSRLRRASGHSRVFMLPNGCTPRDAMSTSAMSRPADMPPGVHLGVVGQLNERIDVGVLQTLADAGYSLVLIGPRTELDPGVGQQIDRLFAHERVHWLGRKSAADLPAYLANLAVGITPYADTSFNRASFPLKTMEYLAAGLPVVSTDLPAVRWLDTPHIRTARDPGCFVGQVAAALAEANDETLAEDRVWFARAHSWRARSDAVRKMVGQLAD